MLKIKDNVNFKKLEKFGFKKVKKGMGYASNRKWVNEFCINEYIVVDKKTNKITLLTNGWCGEAQIVLYDLIQAGLVEKI